MTPSARLQAVVEILEQLEAGRSPADRLLRSFFRARRYAGSGDRAAIGEYVFTVLRHRASFSWRVKSDRPRALVMASLLAEGKTVSEIAALFDGGRYAPALLSDAEMAAIGTEPTELPPLFVQGEFPQILEGELRRAFGPDLLAETRALCARAPVDLRVNTLKTDRPSVLHRLRADGYAAEPARLSPWGIRISSGPGLAALQRHALFTDGVFEFQDEAAQLCALLCAAAPGDRILDLAAGAGGKSLALAALMQNRGEILAYDTSKARLAQLAPRALRAGATIIRERSAAPSGQFDKVLVDAPCSGSGTWRRQPELKWRISSEWLQQLGQMQTALLEQAALLVRPGGRLIYATCSVLPAENADRIAVFCNRHPEFHVVPAGILWRTFLPDAPLAMEGDFFRASPYATGTDGFFVSVLAREGNGEPGRTNPRVIV